MTEEGLVRTDDQPFETLYRSEAPRLWRAVYAYARDRELATDAVSEAFAQCLRRGEAVRNPRAWIWRAAFAIARGELMERDRAMPLSADVDRATDEGDLRHLLDLLGSLPRQQRAAVLLRHYAGYPPREAAKLLGIAPATLRVHLARARRTLARLLQEEGR